MDKAREIAISFCPGESELPFAAHNRAIWIDNLTDAVMMALALEREACAKIADSHTPDYPIHELDDYRCGMRSAGRDIATAIRSRSQTQEG